jgi:hypothetical protein
MANSKVTKKDMYVLIDSVVSAADVSDEVKESIKAFTAHEVDLLNRKRAKSGQTKTQKENVAVAEVVKAVLADATSPMGIPEMLKDARISEYVLENGNSISNQKLSAILAKLGENGTGEVVKTYEKKKPLFALAPTDTTEDEVE